MDELDILKKDWNKQEGNYPQLSYDQIYKMLWKKSSSIVKWIFVISIVEFLLGAVLNIALINEDYWAEVEKIHLTNFTIGLYIVGYLITFFFIWKFYRNYKRISSTDDSATLMTNILKARRTVKWYIGYVIISTFITFIVSFYFTLDYHISNTAPVNAAKDYSFSTTQWLIFLGGATLIIAVILGLIWLFYRLLYGILLKRLNRNYKELKKLEM
jgi:hypothetical protein